MIIEIANLCSPFKPVIPVSSFVVICGSLSLSSRVFTLSFNFSTSFKTYKYSPLSAHKQKTTRMDISLAENGWLPFGQSAASGWLSSSYLAESSQLMAVNGWLSSVGYR